MHDMYVVGLSDTIILVSQTTTHYAEHLTILTVQRIFVVMPPSSLFTAISIVTYVLRFCYDVHTALQGYFMVNQVGGLC